MCDEKLNQEMRDEFKYLFLLSLIKKVAKQGKIDLEICERLNVKNAEVLNCIPLPIA